MASAKKKVAADTTTLRENEKKWTKELLTPGWTLVPNILLTKQHALGLDPVDVNIILQILKHWWHADEAPFPSQIQLAKAMNVDPSTVKRHLSGLRANGFVDWTQRTRKDGGRASNRYDFSGLIHRARELAIAESKERREAADARKTQARSKRARAVLRLVDDDSDE